MDHSDQNEEAAVCDLVPQDLYSGPDRIGSKTFVYTAISRGDIPSYRIGQKLFIPRDWKKRLLNSQLGSA